MKNFEALVNDFALRETKCSICGTYRMQIKKGVWLCPGMYGSPMHYFGLGREEAFKIFLEEKGCTLDEYLRATSSSSSSSSSSATFNTTSQLCFRGRKNNDCETEEWDGTVWKAAAFRAQSKVSNVSQIPKSEWKPCIEYYNGSSWKNVK